MHDLEIAWPEGRARFSPDDSPVAIGRSPEAAVILTDPSISRRHLEFVWVGTSWTANDSSTHGSFDPIGVRLAPTWTVGTNTTVRLGGVEGTELQIELLTTRPNTDGFLPDAPPPPVIDDVPPGPPGLTDDAASAPRLGGADSFPPPFVDAGQPPMPAEVSAPIADHQPPLPPTPSMFDRPADPPRQPPVPPSAFDALPHPPQPPVPPSALDTPSQPPQPPEPPAAFASSPPQPPTPKPEPAAPSALDDFPAPPPQPDKAALSAFDARPDAPPLPPSALGSAPPKPPGPEPAGPSAFDARPEPPPSSPDQSSSIGSLFDPPSPQALAPAGASIVEGNEAGQVGTPNWKPGDPGEPAGLVHGAQGPREHAAQTIISDATIQLSVDDRDFVFLPGTEITVGRDPDCLVTLDERHSLVSRRHLKISYRDDAWYVDDFSSKGTFVDGRRLSSSYKAEGAFLVQLGDDDAGTVMRVITAGEHRGPRSQSLLLLLAVGALALVAVVALTLAVRNRSNDDSMVVIASPGQDPTSVAAADLAAAKQSTVLLLADEGLGSGFFIADNLIVTNQHVAVLAPTLLVAVSREADDPAELEYEAETVAIHPFLDIAVLKLTADDAGAPVDDAGLPAVNLGDSLDLTLGDEVYNTGFPQTLSLISRDDAGELLLPPVSATSGEAASFAIWPGCSNPDRDSFIPLGSPPGVGCAPDGDVAKGIVITTFSSGQGASGSPVFRGNEVVAVVFAGPEDEANAGRNIATSSFRTWLEQVVAENS